MHFNDNLAKKLKCLKKDLGATGIRQGYRGTGNRSYRRQIWVDGLAGFHTAIDLWLEDNRVGLGGVCYPHYGRVEIGTRSVDEVYAEICEKLKAKANETIPY